MGESNGLEILEDIRKKGYMIPVIILTGQGDQEIAVQAMKNGATDYLVKSGLTSESLSKAIRHSINLFKEEQQRIQAEKSLKTQGLLLQGVSEAAIRLLTVYDHESSIKEALEIAGKGGSMDRVYIFQDHVHPENGEEAFSLKYYWCGGDEKNLDEDLRDLTYTELGWDDWVRELRMGKSINHVVDSVKLASKFFQSQGIKSCVFALFKIDYTFLGFALFVNRYSKRIWSSDESRY